MRFRQLDRINQLVPGQRIEAEMTLTGREDYLRDHFPRFPVQPGVMMLESLFQAAQFLVRASGDFRAGLVILRGVKNVKFASFLQPGDTLTVEAEIVKVDGSVTTLKASGSNPRGDLCVSGRLLVDCVQTAQPASVDQHASRYMQQIIEQLQQSAMV